MYLALYRKYRPRTFDEVISQKYITATLKNQVESGSTGHAYLFTGSRGTGKTSCAKILAMAVNCEDPQNGNPCLKCDRCREILNGTSTDIVEMDAASNNGVDDVRTLRDEVAYTPVSCKYRVYIIDEVHMLSSQAFNALLKTLEEPPPHVKFILATTEVHKVLATISSRCQRFEFHRVSTEESTERLLKVAEKESVRLDKRAAELISRLSDGGMRDALSILDRCISASEDITPQTVRDCVGVADDAHLFALSEMVARHDTAGCIRLLNELHKGAKDISLIIGELAEHYRDMMLYKSAPNNKELLNVLPDEQDKLFAISDMYSLDEILRCLTLLQQCADGIGRVKQRKTLAEMCFVRMCAGSDITSAAAVQTEAPKPPTPVIPSSSSAGSQKIEFREIEKDDPAPAKKRSEGEMSASERVQFARISTELQKTEKMVNSTANTGASVEVNETRTAVPSGEPAVEQNPEKAAPIEKTEPSTAVPNAKSDLEKVSPDERSEPEPESKISAPEVNSEPPVEYIAPPISQNNEPAAADDIFDHGIPDYGEPPPEFTTYNSPPPSMLDFEPSAAAAGSTVNYKAPETESAAKPVTREAEHPTVIDEESAANIAALTQEQWEAAIPKTGAFYSKMLENSKIKAEGDILIISTSNKTILNNVKGKEITNYEKEISKALGFHVHLKFVSDKSKTKETARSPLQAFLDKCCENNIKVIIIE